jgi:hypothetical protein
MPQLLSEGSKNQQIRVHGVNLILAPPGIVRLCLYETVSREALFLHRKAEGKAAVFWPPLANSGTDEVVEWIV